MHKATRRALIMSSILAASALATAPASATVFKNYKNENYCLTVSGGIPTTGTALVIEPCDGFNEQSWGSTPFYNPDDGQHVQLFNNDAPSPPTSNAECIALNNNGSISNGTNGIVWTCSTHTTDQSWSVTFQGYDLATHECFSIESMKGDQNGVHRVLGVSGGNMSAGTHVILWDFFNNDQHNDQYWCEY